ncbi:unnamed protein product [Mytilus coruscus]|uniref:Uncharacterized protein n=1 Tax=Mytilus coruscus TaxID=42192 RepID=A0A6J7ZXM3_MYTCO|nr:unnamed protein product [Mytilus coruscus]
MKCTYNKDFNLKIIAFCIECNTNIMKLQNCIKNIKNEVADLEDELVCASAYEAKSGNSFTKVVKDRLKKINPSKYSQSSVLLRDVIALKTAYDNKIPTVSQNDKLEFPKKIKEVNAKIKKEYDSDSSITDSPPCKKMYTGTPQKFRQTVRQHMHCSDYVYSPNPFPINFPTYYPGNVVCGIPFLNQHMSTGFNTEYHHVQQVVQNMHNCFPPRHANAFPIQQQSAPFFTNNYSIFGCYTF